MNKKNLQLLIEEIEKPETYFNMAYLTDCIGGQIRKMTGNYGGFSAFSISRFLEIDSEEATNLFIGRTLEGEDLFTKEQANSMELLEKHSKEVILKYLKSL